MTKPVLSSCGLCLGLGLAAVPGVDVVFAASVDLASFSGWNPGDLRYEAMISRITEATLGAGKWLGGPGSWSGRKGFTFFQGRAEYKKT